MGKGNRARLKRDEASLASANTAANPAKGNKGVPLWLGNLILAVFVLLLVVVLVVNAVTSSGILFKLSNYGSSSDFELTGSQMTYIFKSIYNDFVSQYSSYLTYFGLNTGASLKDQQSVYTDDAGNAMTWFEVFAEQTEAQAKQLLVLCQMAKNEGLYAVSEEDQADIDEAIESMSSEALNYGYSLSSYIKAIYGAGVTEKDIRTVMEYQIVSQAYYEVVKDRLVDAISSDRVDTYFNENQNKFLSIDYLSYTISVVKDTVATSADEATKTEAENKYTADKELADAYATKLKEAADAKAFLSVLVDYIMEALADDEFEEEYTEEFKSLKAEEKHTDEQKKAFKELTLKNLKAELLKIDVFAEEDDEEDTDETENDKDTEKTALQKAEEKLYADILATYTTVIEGTYVKGGSYVEDDDLSEWLFNADRKVGDSKSEPTESDKKDSYKVDVTYVAKTKYKDTTLTKNAGHILFTESAHDDPKKKAEEVLATYKAGTLSREAFEALGKQHTEDSSIFYENIYKGQMVEEFEDWVYDEDRKVGDTSVIETDYGFHIMYFDGDGLEMWHLNVQNAIFSEDYEAWFEKATTDTATKINSKNINKIDI